MKNLFDCVPIF